MPVNTPSITAGQALDALRAGYAAQTDGGLTASWMLHGPPGIGKTEIVQQLAHETGARLHDLRLTTIEPADLRGLPFYDYTARRTVWYPPEDLPAPGAPAILFLDELTAAAPILQPTIYGLLQERRIGTWHLPDTAFVVAAGNGPEDGAIAYEMGTALADRLIHLALRAEAGDWLRGFAVPQGVHPAVAAFIRLRPDLLDTTEDSLRRGETIACTPRAWARVSDILGAIPDRTTRDVLIAGVVGEAPAAEFALLEREAATQINAEAIMAASPRDRPELYPDTLHALTALTYAIVALADEESLPDAIEVMAGIRTLATDRGTTELERLPLGELSSYGFELLIERALERGWQEAFRDAPGYAAHMAARAS
ncbi:AAA family ATPase [Jannaschia aquimarina]|uniref:AAA domain (Dynein-related subfamily) n=1 Tax=Jannaschia aquimarina TaxID=935700 RepID=A0A0D1CJW2_9RHOB|nr:MoxR family ATPase [Jannaschia aquimarina]KIT15032.1 AAA domain (dynein-related subfamily) [Jannaschia aquimarina]SNS62381.1 MoxR-like ATPase [Jannaschia aquimarina]